MLDSIIGSVLSNVLSWEYKIVAVGLIERDSVMAVIDVLQRELF